VIALKFYTVRAYQSDSLLFAVFLAKRYQHVLYLEAMPSSRYTNHFKEKNGEVWRRLQLFGWLS